MIVKTKKYQLTQKTYIRLGMDNILREQWWVWFIPAAILVLGLLAGFPWWGLGIGLTASLLYVLFWGVQFGGASQMEQNKMMFERFTYEIDSRQILMKLNERQGMPFTWDKILKVRKTADAFVLVISKGQFLYWPFDIFRSELDLKFTEGLLRRKGLLKDEKAEAEKK